jgi:F-type H+-transporting ATPase subunit c
LLASTVSVGAGAGTPIIMPVAAGQRPEAARAITSQVIEMARRNCQTGGTTPERQATMSSPDLLPLAVALLIGVPALGSCIGIGLASMKLLETSGRQPELMPELQAKFFLAVGVTDGAFIIATGIGLWFATANPFR